jgi:opacity protein-like surface antigen
MKKMTLVVLVSSALLAPIGAFAADSGFYVGGGYSALTLDSNDVSSNADVDSLFIRGGFQINEYLAAEARVGSGIQDDRINGIKVELEDIYGVYLKAGLPTTVGLYPYALIGATHAKIKFSAAGLHDSTSDSDISYGVGVDYAFNQQISAGLEWANLYDQDGDKISGVTLGVNYKF